MQPLFRQYAGIFVRGMCMGAADLIPGVSGGTVAFISGIYQRLLSAIAAFASVPLYKDVLSLQIASAWRRGDCTFLAVLFAGILSAVLLLADLLHYLLREHAHLLLAFFFGLVLASAFALLREVQNRRAGLILFFLFGAAAGLAVSLAPTTNADPTLPVLFAGGAVAICAMLLPGISGSYILLVIGLYGHVINALHEREWLLVVVFAAGCGFGLLMFARLLSFLLRRFYDPMLVFLTGLMLGAAPKLWPWKENAEGLKMILQPNVWPGAFDGNPQIFMAVVLAACGAVVVLLLLRLANTRPDQQNE